MALRSLVLLAVDTLVRGVIAELPLTVLVGVDVVIVDDRRCCGRWDEEGWRRCDGIYCKHE